MSTGQVLLYDLRNNKPFRVKDHMYELPIKDVMFLNDHVLSMDSSIVKIWNEETVRMLIAIVTKLPL
jgi:ribosome biogenesis protein ENP2